MNKLYYSPEAMSDLDEIWNYIFEDLISKHLRVLRECGLVQVQIKAQHRIYCLNAEPLAEIDEWLNSYRKMWNKHVDALAEHLNQKKNHGR